MATLFYIAVALSVLVYGIYRRSYPRPIPGIPYNPESAKRVTGDKAELLKSYRQNGAFHDFRYALTQRHGFPLVQIFTQPFARPLLFLDDPREVEDILLRRNKEFDRSLITTYIIGAIMPHSTIVKQTNAHWKAQRKPWTDVMAPDFLRRIVAPRLYDAGLDLIELWKAKAARAGKVHVDIAHDFDTAALDAIWAAVLGENLGGLSDQINATKGFSKENATHKTYDIASGLDMQNTLKFLNKSALGWKKFNFPVLQLWLMRRGKDYRKFDGIKNKQIERLMRSSIKKFQDAIESGVEAPDGCAMDLVLRREVQAAHKAGVPLRDLTKDVELRDELFLLLWAGHDTTSNTLSWWTKYMSRFQGAQDKLRTALREAFPGPGLPTAHEILDSDIPYLDGTIEEAMRLAATTSVIRQALVDTEILGKKVPKGTSISFNTVLHHRPVPVPEALRSPSSRAAHEKRGRLGIEGPAGDNLSDFVPERWLVTDEDGKVAFDAYSIPRIGFGDGPRGCFGRKLAMHELRIMITLATLSFKLLPLPDELDNMRVAETFFRKPKDCYAKFEVLL